MTFATQYAGSIPVLCSPLFLRLPIVLPGVANAKAHAQPMRLAHALYVFPHPKPPPTAHRRRWLRDRSAGFESQLAMRAEPH